MNGLEHSIGRASHYGNCVFHTFRRVEVLVEGLDLFKETLRIGCGERVGIDADEILSCRVGVILNLRPVNVQHLDREAAGA